MDAALNLRDTRLDGHDSDILALQGAGPFATSSDLTAAETSLPSAIDAILAQLAALTTGGGSNLINAQAWSGEITWDLLLGTNTLRNLHFNAPLSVSLQNDNFTLSLACDSYSVAEADAAVAAALAPFETASQRDAAIAAALAAYSTTAQMDAAIAAAVAAIDLSPYYTSAQTDAAITAALVPVTLANAPAWGANPPTWELLKGTNVLRNLHFAGPLSASYQNNTDTLEIDCDSYEKAETFTQAETNAAISAALGALNLGQYQTSAQVDTAISDALVPYYTAAQVDAEIAANGFNAADYFTRTQSDSRYFPNNANPGNAEVFTLVRDSVSIPRQIRGILPRAPLAWSYLFSGTITELRCDAYSKAEADGRYLSSTGYTGALDGRYLVTNANAGSSEVFTIIRDANAVPRQLRGVLPRAPLGWSHILSGTVTELTCDAWTKAEADGRFYIRSLADSTFAPMSTDTGLQNLNLQVIDHETRLSSLEASGGVPDPVVTGAVHGSGTALTLRAGSTNVRIEAQDTTSLANFGLVENFLGGAPRLRVDEEIFIDDVSGTAAGLKTNAVSARPGDNLLTISGGVNGVSVIGAGLAVAGIARATAQVTTPVLATDAGARST